MRALVTGATGMLGADLCAALETRGHTVTRTARADTSPDVLPLDITDREQTLHVIADARPDVVFHCAAWTNVDGAERDPDAAFAVNEQGAANVARACAVSEAWMVYVSTDFVFDGEKCRPYREDDPVHPLGAYGASKEAGERQVHEILPDRHLIARTSWLFGPHGKNFVQTIQRLAATRSEVPVVADQIGCPTHTADLARVLIDLTEAKATLGTYHVSGAGQCSWFEFAQAIAAKCGLPGAIVPITAADYAERFGSPTRRPAYSVMAHDALGRVGLDTMPPWEAALEEYLRR